MLNELAAFVRGHARGQCFVEIINLVPRGLQFNGGGPIFGDGFSWHATDRFQGGTPHDKATAMADHGVHGVPSRLKSSEEEALFVFERTFQAKIASHGVFIEKVLRCLNHRDFFIAEKAGGALDKIAARKKIGVETNDQFAAGQRQCMIQIARFRVSIVRTIHVFAAKFGGELSHGGTALVVEQINFFSRIIDRLAADNCPAQHLDGFGIGGDENIDGREIFTGLNGSL